MRWLKLKQHHKPAALPLSNSLRGVLQIINAVGSALIVGQGGATYELNDLEAKLKKYGIIEMVRPGKLVMVKGKEAT